MQLGGNINALTFFRQHNCSTLDSQQKYHSRASALYKEKLANTSAQSMRMYGTQLYVEAGHGAETAEPQEKKEEDFFSEQETLPASNPVAVNIPTLIKSEVIVPKPAAESDNSSTAGPNVEAITNPTQAATEAKPAVKSLIGQRKPAAKKPGMGAKKGLGATKIQTNFEDIEREAQLADSMRSQKKQEAPTVEEAESQLSSLRLTYQDLSVETKKQAEKLQKADPNKAQQIERLGMGLLGGTSSGPRTVSHSAISDMQVIQQDFSSNSASSVLSSLDRKKYPLSEEPTTSYFSKSSGLDDLLGPREKGRDSEWDMLSEVSAAPKSSSSSYGSASARTSAATSQGSSLSSGGAGNGEALKKFGNAKAISSDQFFQDANGADYERRANLSRFEGSTGISSSDYFGSGNTQARGYSSSSASYNIQTPDLDEVKESVRQGVTKVASKLSSLANNLASSIQDRYGY